MFRTHTLIASFALVVFALGCGAPREEEIQIKGGNDPLANAKSILQSYANGQPPSSEVASYPKIVDDVRKTDPAKADILEKGFADLQRSKSGHASKAKELLKKLE